MDQTRTLEKGYFWKIKKKYSKSIEKNEIENLTSFFGGEIERAQQESIQF